MSSYKIEVEGKDLLRLSFLEPAQNDRIVKDASRRLDALIGDGQLAGGEVIRINGPASVPVAMVIAHRLCHLFEAVACYDPKLSKYVVVSAHGGDHNVGDLID